MALKQISERKFEERISTYLENIMSIDLFFDNRRMLYYTGSIFCIEMNLNDTTFWHQIGASKRSLFEMVSENIVSKNLNEDENNTALESTFEGYTAAKTLQFEEFTKFHSEIICGDWFIGGYDPMNMIKNMDRILCNHFVILMDSEQKEQLFIKGPVMVILKHGTNNLVCSYIK